MVRALVGKVKTLWRYPVKSMQGEELEISEVVTKGLLGDRAYALWDVATSRVASAKNPKKWAALLNCHAKLAQTPETSKPIPPVEISLANGVHLSSEQADLNVHLSNWIGREVEFLSSPLETPTLSQGELPPDLEILKTTARYNNVIAGIRLSVQQGGTIRIGDQARGLPL